MNCALQKDFVRLVENLYMFGNVDNMKSVLTDSTHEVRSRIFGPKRDEVTGELRKLQNDALNDLYTSSNIFRLNKSSRI